MTAITPELLNVKALEWAKFEADSVRLHCFPNLDEYWKRPLGHFAAFGQDGLNDAIATLYEATRIVIGTTEIARNSSQNERLAVGITCPGKMRNTKP